MLGEGEEITDCFRAGLIMRCVIPSYLECIDFLVHADFDRELLLDENIAEPILREGLSRRTFPKTEVNIALLRNIALHYGLSPESISDEVIFARAVAHLKSLVKEYCRAADVDLSQFEDEHFERYFEQYPFEEVRTFLFDMIDVCRTYLTKDEWGVDHTRRFGESYIEVHVLRADDPDADMYGDDSEQPPDEGESWK